MHSPNHPGELRRYASWLSSTILVLLVVAAGDAQAQELDPPLAPRARIPVLSLLPGPDPRIGEVDRVMSDSIVFRPQGEGDVRSIPFPDIRELCITGGARPKSHRVVVSDTQAQELDPPLAPGARIRVLSPLLGPDPRIGKVDRVMSDSIVFRPQGEGDVRSIPFPDIRELWISDGARPKSHRVAKWASLGFGLGFGGSLAFWLVKGEGDSSAWGDYRESHLAAGAIGGVTGAILGARGSSERWVSVRIQRVPEAAAVRAVVTVQVLRLGRDRP
jgi:hypothetical protein